MSATAEFLSEVPNLKRRAILLAAAELFMEEGYAAVSMDAVAKAAGVSKATLYAHFSGKEALFEAIVSAGCESMRRRADGFLGGHDRPLRDALVELGLHWLRFMLRPQVRALHRVMVAEAARFPALARAFYAAGPQAMQGWLTGWMAGESARGHLRPDVPPAQAAEHFLCLLRGDLFVRATFGLVDEEMAAAELPSIAERAADAFLLLYGAPALAPADGFA
ncbi:transcriptional regulator, TetR family [Acetobacteraceae bacterium AT-5844]|nr:transcriptional regulator, TetR family [Acetobacteraceae bacterium AT-5844]